VIRALIADDEELSLRALQQMLRRHADVEVVAECRDGVEAREALEAQRPDVAFLDIRMPLASGLDLALSRDRGAQTLVVFVTAFDQFALPAFDADAADYLTKPLTEERFDAAIERVRQRVLVRRVAEEGTAARAGGSRREYVHRLVTRVGPLDVIIPVDAIDYIEADDVYAAVIAHPKRHLVRTSLDTLERSLDPVLFVRVHRSYIVRIARVSVVRHRPGARAEVVMSCGAVLPVSRRRRPSLSRIFPPATLAHRSR